MKQGPRIYNLFPLLVGKISRWTSQLPRIAAMGFDWVFVNPFHYPGFSGSLYAVQDYYRLNPLFEENGRDPASLLRDFVNEAGENGLSVMMDLVINHTARDAELATSHPDWYLRDEAGELSSPYAVDPDDPSNVTLWGDLAALDYSARPQRTALIAYWQNLVRYYIRLGFRGFRCDAAYKIPGDVWSEIIGSARAGDRLDVSADIYMEGHDVLGAVLKFREPAAPDWSEVPMNLVNNDRWWAAFPLAKNTLYRYTIEAWMDRFESWRRETAVKLEAPAATLRWKSRRGGG